jgi:opacity protein-like surface antigen
MKTILLSLSLIMAAACSTSAQSEQPKKMEAVAFKGQLMLLADASIFDPDKPDTYYFNFGGPSLRINRGKSSAALTFNPSMRTQWMDGKPYFAPVLGFGGEYAYQRLVIGMTEYFDAKKGTWQLAIGAGFRFK